jgi:hypothetical protein
MAIIAAHPNTYLYLIEEVLGNSEEPDEMKVQKHLVLAWRIGDEDGMETIPVFIGGTTVSDLWADKHWFYTTEDGYYLAWNDDCDNRMSLEQAIREVEKKIKKNKSSR